MPVIAKILGVSVGELFGEPKNVHPDVHTDVHPDKKYKVEKYKSELKEDQAVYNRIHQLEAENQQLKAANSALIEAFKAIGAGKGQP